MSDRLKEQIVFHGEDLTDLYKLVPKECLPKELGGENDLKQFTGKELEEMDKLLDFYDK